MTVDSLNSNKPNVIELSSVTKVYQMGSQEVKALAGVDLTVKQGEFIAVTGPSGSGKSTLMNIIGCLDVPTDGKYILNGVEVGSMKDSGLAHTRNRLIGFVFQTYNLLPKLTAQENVELPLIYGGAISRKFKALEALDKVGLSDRSNHLPAELSGGQQQRVGIARALVTNPSILLADEPTGNLDTQSTGEIMALINELNQQDDLTVVLVTHENEIAMSAQRILNMVDGSIVKDYMIRTVS